MVTKADIVYWLQFEERNNLQNCLYIYNYFLLRGGEKGKVHAPALHTQLTGKRKIDRSKRSENRPSVQQIEYPTHLYIKKIMYIHVCLSLSFSHTLFSPPLQSLLNIEDFKSRKCLDS